MGALMFTLMNMAPKPPDAYISSKAAVGSTTKIRFQ
jgi:hypothetical protein